MKTWPDLRQILMGIRWAVVGGVATRAYMPERSTQDIDILVHPQDAQQAIQKMVQAGYEIVSELTIPGKVVRSPEGAEVDVLFGGALWTGEALENTRQDAAGFPVLDLPYLVLMKIETARTQDISDVARMLGLASEHDLESVRAVVQRYAPDAVEDLESLIYLGKMELGGISEGKT